MFKSKLIFLKSHFLQDQKAYGILDSQSKNASSQDRIIILVCGCDMVNYSTFFLLADDVSTAQVSYIVIA